MTSRATQTYTDATDDSVAELMGYRRADGSVGIRNHVVIVATVQCSSTVARRIADLTGTAAITHECGCMELGPESEHTRRVLSGVIRHPNVGAALVVGLGCEQVSADALAQQANGKAVAILNIQKEGGVAAAIEHGAELARDLQARISTAQRDAADISKLTLAVQCGSSDTGSGLASNPAVGVLTDLLVAVGGRALMGETGSLYGAEGVLIARSISPDVRERLMEITDRLERFCNRMGTSLREANPSPGNIAGGLTTLVEKSLGAARKGGAAPILGVLRAAEAPPEASRGLWIMDTTRGVDALATSDMVAGGAQIVAFTTGRGYPVGNPIAPVVKITATRRTIETMAETIDFDASPVLQGLETVDQCGQRLFAQILAVANGKLTKAERLGHHLFGIGRVLA